MGWKIWATSLAARITATTTRNKRSRRPDGCYGHDRWTGPPGCWIKRRRSLRSADAPSAQP